MNNLWMEAKKHGRWWSERTAAKTCQQLAWGGAGWPVRSLTCDSRKLGENSKEIVSITPHRICHSTLGSRHDMTHKRPPHTNKPRKSDMNANLFKRRNLIIFLIDFVWWFSCRAENRIAFIRCPIDNSKTTTWSFFDPKNERSWPVSIVCWRDRAACGGWTLLWRNHGSEILRPPFAVFIVSKSIATVQKLNFTLNRLIGLFHCVYDPSIPKSLSRAPLQRFLIEKALFLSPDVLDTTRKLSLWVFLVLFRDWKKRVD